MPLLDRLRNLLKHRPDHPRSPDPHPEPTPVLTSNPSPTMLAALNGHRTAAGLAPLAASPVLTAVAQPWAVSMARSGRLGHGDFAGRMNATIPNRLAAENVAQGQLDETEVIASWMASAGHRANILGPYDSVGWGMADGKGGRYWAAIFAKLS